MMRNLIWAPNSWENVILRGGVTATSHHGGRGGRGEGRPQNTPASPLLLQASRDLAEGCRTEICLPTLLFLPPKFLQRRLPTRVSKGPIFDIRLSSLSKKDTKEFLFRKRTEGKDWGSQGTPPNPKQITKLQHCLNGVRQILRVPPGLSSVFGCVWRRQECW